MPSGEMEGINKASWIQMFEDQETALIISYYFLQGFLFCFG